LYKYMHYVCTYSAWKQIISKRVIHYDPAERMRQFVTKKPMYSTVFTKEQKKINAHEIEIFGCRVNTQHRVPLLFSMTFRELPSCVAVGQV
jgi:hypothetical protein